MVDEQGIINAFLTDCNLQQMASSFLLIHTSTGLMLIPTKNLTCTLNDQQI
jgi:hypothetical protein